ncbi:hypothetical protein [Daejeonella lutea]|uniref:Pentapeptide repeat-containing protein n=1 Tax=Daejeonella lutea TaxID=572036 RepID=A0A1T5B0L0_9SPHI|nr:hypothetical protein [Daejeonella lutea]SKB40798.1 hypothetical protein SAMN05661099_1187 [Daejeonella lutea]
MPSILKATPYQTISSIEPGQAILPIKNDDFRLVRFKEGTTTLNYSRCRFNHLTIDNVEDIVFGTVHVAFFNCIIDNLVIEKIISKNLTFSFFSCVVNARIDGENLLDITFNNCVTTSGIYINRGQKVNIKFTKENFNEGDWKSLFIQYYITDIKDILESNQRYSIDKATEIICSSNFKPEKHPWELSVILSISYDSELEDRLTHISDMTLRSLSLRGSANGKILVENTTIDEWYISDFEPKGEVAFYDIEPVDGGTSKKIGIHSSNLDFVKFDRVIFASYNAISFFRTRFSKAVFTSCDFPDNYNAFSRFMNIPNVHYAEEKPKNYEKRQYEMFLQLKIALEETGNIYEAHKLHAISHEALKNIQGLPGWDRAILSINSFSNDHGLSIKKAIRGFCWFSIPLYLMYLFSIGRLLNGNPIDWNLIGYYFSFVDLTHKNDFLTNKNELNGWSSFFDWGGKIVVGFFIYQFIAAFRKYGKK